MILKKNTPILISILLIFCISCNKDDVDRSDYRVIQVRNYLDDRPSYSIYYQYEEEKLLSSVGFAPSISGDSTKSQFEYPDNSSMIEWGYSKTGTEWLHSNRKEYKIDNQNVTQLFLYIYSNDTAGTPFRRIEYTYEEDKLAEETWFNYTFGENGLNYRNAYRYEEDKLTGSVHYMDNDSDWIEDGKDEVFYHGSEIDSIIQYYYDLTAYYKNIKYEYNYSRGRIARVNWYRYLSSSDKWESNGYQEFTYNGEGNLETSSMEFNGMLYRSEYIYEKGKGNYEQTIYHLSGAAEKILPYPE